MSKFLFTRLYKHTLIAAKSLDSSLTFHNKSFRASEARKFMRFLPTEFKNSVWLRSVDCEEEEITCEWIVRASFARAFSESEKLNFSDNCFAAMRMLNERNEMLQSKPLSSFQKPKHVHLSVGQVFRHKKYGYRGVVIAHWPQCPIEDEEERDQWLQTWGPFHDGNDQAFYSTLVDTKDRPLGFKTIAAEENLEPLDDVESPIEHPELDAYFDGFEYGHHKLKKKLLDRFPEDW
mmetsp:Transcript_7461/g.8585  ORF Transcript_7461/g.8585 Transcript_7461/m.8585 type:complete len:234 (+) Transcript_7461:190-891(+)